MKYEIKAQNLKSFVEDEHIQLPRFQRKSTWDGRKNFELCISIFSGYPTGVCVLEINKDNRGKSVKWLLDGRQRRNAITKIWEDPEVIYTWAKKWIGFKNSDQASEVKDRFYEKLDDYLEKDDDIIDKNESDQNETEELDSTLYQESSDDIYTNESKTNRSEQQKKLDLLCKIITTVHNKKNGQSGFSRPFNFKFIDKLPYVEYENEKILNSKKLVSFIDDYKKYCNLNDKDYVAKDNFKDYIKFRFGIDHTNNQQQILQLDKHIDREWNDIIDRIELINNIRDILSNAEIGLIIIDGFKPSDSQMIFNIINSKGSLLKAVEILSARPTWNKIIEKPSSEQESKTKELYRFLGITHKDTVKWDLAATLLDRLNDTNTLFKTFEHNKSNSDFEKKITYGFKILAGIYTGGIKKDDIEKLGKSSDINWGSDIETLICELNNLTKLIFSSEYFKYLKSWRFSLMNILSDTICLNFILIMYQDWKNKGKPYGSSGASRIVQKNAYILLDQMIYEYITNQWRGASDNKIAKNITDVKDNSDKDLFQPIDQTKWENILSDIMYHKPLTTGVEAVLVHLYCTRHISAPDSKYNIEVDHIIPQQIFKESTLKEKDIIKNGLFNLALLPKDENISKSNKALKDITSDWLKDEIEKYEFIKKSDFERFSSLANLKELKKMREKELVNKFITARSKILYE